jgi:hypothetical protein
VDQLGHILLYILCMVLSLRMWSSEFLLCRVYCWLYLYWTREALIWARWNLNEKGCCSL